MFGLLGFKGRSQIAKGRTLDTDAVPRSPIIGSQAPPPSPVIDITRRHRKPEVSSSASLPSSQTIPRRPIRDPSRPRAPPGPAAVHRTSPRNSLRTIPEAFVLNPFRDCEIPTPRLMDESVMEAMGNMRNVAHYVPHTSPGGEVLEHSAAAEYVDSRGEKIPWAVPVEDPFAKAPPSMLSRADAFFRSNANRNHIEATDPESPVTDYLQVDIPHITFPDVQNRSSSLNR